MQPLLAHACTKHSCNQCACVHASICMYRHVTCAGATQTFAHTFNHCTPMYLGSLHACTFALLNILHAHMQRDSNATLMRSALEALCAPPQRWGSSCVCTCTREVAYSHLKWETLSSTGSPSSGFIFRRIRQAHFWLLKCLPSLPCSSVPFTFCFSCCLSIINSQNRKLRCRRWVWS